MVSGRVVAGLAASSPSQLGGAAAAELLLGTLQCGCGCESRDMEPERVRGRERSEGPQTAEALLRCFLPSPLMLSLLLQLPCPPF